MADDERVVLLGTVQERQSVDDASPYACKAGGSPAWYNRSAPPQEAENLVCPNCSKPLFLVTQVYAPVDTDRTLYVFGCNSVACTELPGSWRVLRDESEATQVVSTTAVAPSDAAPQALGSAWDAGSDSDSSDWGDNDDDDGDDPFSSMSTGGGGASDDFIDLEKLLLQRDDAMSAATNPVASKKPSKASGASAPPAPQAAAMPRQASVRAFPAKPIEVVDEPYEDYTAENDYSHENALLEDYMKQEEEDKSADVGDLRKILSSAKKGGADGSGAGKGSSSEAYEKTPAQQRHFLRFQKRIARCPLQCLRYDYGGEPLWPMPKPHGLKIPKCICGEERVFELQLTPTLMYFLKVDELAGPIEPTLRAVAPAAATAREAASITSATSASAGSSNAVAKSPLTPKSAGGAMDWMGVLVYSCPKSCSRSREEFVHVLPAEKA